MLCPTSRFQEGATVTDLQVTGQAAAPAPGWYPDPAGGSGTRWWSGEAWTDHVQAAPEPIAPAAPSAVTSSGVPFRLFADGGFDPAVLEPVTGPETQSDWHTQAVRAPQVSRQAHGSVSLSTEVPAVRRHDPYRQRNWTAGLALVLAVLGIAALGWRSVADLPAVTQSIFAGGPIAISLLALVLAIRRGGGLILSIVALVLSAGVLLAGLLVEPELIRQATESVLGLLPR
jgi:hypothetical protein